MGVLVRLVPVVASPMMVDENGSSEGRWWQVAVGVVRKERRKKIKRMERGKMRVAIRTYFWMNVRMKPKNGGSRLVL